MMLSQRFGRLFCCDFFFTCVLFFFYYLFSMLFHIFATEKQVPCQKYCAITYRRLFIIYQAFTARWTPGFLITSIHLIFAHDVTHGNSRPGSSARLTSYAICTEQRNKKKLSWRKISSATVQQSQSRIRLPLTHTVFLLLLLFIHTK